MVFMPEPQTLFSVVAPVDSGMPAAIAAWRAGAWPRLGRQHAAHEDFGNVAGRDARLLQCGGDGGRAQGRGRHAVELAEEGADGGALGGGDDDVGHGKLVDA